MLLSNRTDEAARRWRSSRRRPVPEAEGQVFAAVGEPVEGEHAGIGRDAVGKADGSRTCVRMVATGTLVATGTAGPLGSGSVTVCRRPQVVPKRDDSA